MSQNQNPEREAPNLETIQYEPLPKDEDDIEFLNAFLQCVSLSSFPNGFPMKINLPLDVATAIARSLKANLPTYYFTIERM